MKTSLLIAGSLALVPMTYAQDKPNIIIILADDLGFSDLGCFGGEIHTPVLDKLAKNGVRMTQMYNSARSCPSRANLLTGLYPHQTGLGHMDGSHPAWYRKDIPVSVPIRTTSRLQKSRRCRIFYGYVGKVASRE